MKLLNRQTRWILAAFLACLPGLPLNAQESSQSGGSTSAGDAAPSGESGHKAPDGNPLESLFTPQPQYVTPQTVANPQPSIPAGEANPIKNLFNIQPQFPNSQNPGYQTPEAPKGTDNHLQGFFTPPNQFVTPQTVVNPQPVPKYLIPDFAKIQAEEEEKQAAAAAAASGGAGSSTASAPDAGKSSATGASEKEKSKEGKDKEKSKSEDKDKSKTGEKSDKDKENEKDKTAGKEGSDKDKDKAAADKEGADKDKAVSDKEGADKDKAAADKEGPDKDKAAADKEGADKDKKKEAEAPKVGPYNPLSEALFFISVGQYQRSLDLLGKVLLKNPNDAQAHYIKAVASVSMRSYQQAADEYRKVLNLVPRTDLSRRALEGLKKLGF